jgi:hypothetical protein
MGDALQLRGALLGLHDAAVGDFQLARDARVGLLDSLLERDNLVGLNAPGLLSRLFGGTANPSGDAALRLEIGERLGVLIGLGGFVLRLLDLGRDQVRFVG